MSNQLSIQNDLVQTHLWCGIGALSAALEIKASEALQLLKTSSLRKQIKAVSYSEMRHALYCRLSMGEGDSLDSRQYPRTASECPTLRNWSERQYRESNRTYIICITGHWIVVRNDEWICSLTGRSRSMDDCPYLMARVRFVVSFMDPRR